MNLRKDEWQEAYEAIMQMFEDLENAEKIDGKVFHEEEADRYDQIAVLCYRVFKSNYADEAKIKIERPTNEKPFVGVTVYMECFELCQQNKTDFIELIQLADEVIFYGDEEHYFHMTFYVHDIWTEDAGDKNEPMADA